MQTTRRSARPYLLAITLLIGTGSPVLAAPRGPSSQETPETAAANRAKALPLFRQGIAKFDAGYYREAITLFEQAYKLFPSAKIHTRIALCYKWLGNNLKALDHYEAFLKQVRGTPEAEKEAVLVKQVTMEVRNLLQLIGQLRIVAEGPPGTEIRVNGQLAGTAPLDQVIRIQPGAVNITAIGKGHYAFKRDLQLAGGQLFTVRVTLIKIKPKVVRKFIQVHTPWYKRWWFWTSVGVVVAAGAAGAAVGAYYGRPSRELQGVPINHDSLGVRF